VQEFKFFYRAMKFLKSVSLSKYPIKVRRTEIKENASGFCIKKDGYFLILIDKNLSEEHSIDILLHEIAHADSWAEGYNHGLDWAIAFRRLYNLWEAFLDDWNEKILNGEK